MLKESVFEKKFIKRLKTLPRVYVPPKTDPGAIRGLPDRVICANGRYIAIEFKRSIKDALTYAPRTALQIRTLEEIHMAGGFAIMCYPQNAEYVFNTIRGMTNERT